MLKFMQCIIHLVSWSYRFLIKGILHRFTHLCELQRLCYGLESGAPRSLAVEKSLTMSRNSQIRDILVCDKTKSSREALEGAVTTVLRIKKIKPQIHPQFPKSFAKCMEHIWGYCALSDIIESLRKVPYDSNNAEHEAKLLYLWNTLVPNEQLENRITKQWQRIGFQGDDPMTDFRGMGMLGLENLIYFSKEHTSIAQRILTRSHHPKHGYAFAIVGINLTHLAYHLIRDGSAKTHVYNATRSPPSLRTFHQIYCYLFVEFDRFWLNSKPSNIMDFSPVRNKFERSIREKLKDENTYFKLVVSVDQV